MACFTPEMCIRDRGTCKLTLNVKNGIIEEALVETSGCSGTVSYTHLDVYKRQNRKWWIWRTF